MPLLDDELAAAILKAFVPQAGDLPMAGSGERERVVAFLHMHLGARLLTAPRGQISEVEL